MSEQQIPPPPAQEQQQPDASANIADETEDLSSERILRMRLPPHAPAVDESGLDWTAFKEEIDTAKARLKTHGAIILRGHAYAAELASLVVHHWAGESLRVQHVRAESPCLLRPPAELAECLERQYAEGKCREGDVLRLDIRVEAGAFAIALWTDRWFDEVIKLLQPYAGVVVIALTQERHRLPAALESIASLECHLTVPWVKILRHRWAADCDLSAAALMPAEEHIRRKVLREPEREPRFAAALSTMRLPAEVLDDPVNQINQLLHEVLLRGGDDDALAELMEQDWRSGMRRILLGLFALFSGSQYGASYGVMRVLGYRMAEGMSVRVPQEKEQTIERDASGKIVSTRAANVFETVDAAEEWLTRLDTLLRECGLITQVKEQVTVVTCSGRYGWSDQLLREEIRDRYPGCIHRLVEQTLDKQLLFSVTENYAEFTQLAAQLLLAAHILDPHAYPLRPLVDRVLRDATHATQDRREGQQERAQWDRVGFGLAWFLAQLTSVRVVDGTTEQPLLAEIVDEALRLRRYRQVKLLTLAFGRLTQWGETDVERYVVEILERADVFGAEQVNELWQLSYRFLRPVVRRSVDDRRRLLRNLASRQGGSLLVQHVREKLIAHLWHGALRDDFAIPSPPLERTCASLMQGPAEHLDDVLRLVMSSEPWRMWFGGNPPDIWADTARALLSGANTCSTVVPSLMREQLEQRLESIITEHCEQRTVEARSHAQRESIALLEKEIEALNQAGAPQRAYEDVLRKVRETRENLELGERWFRPYMHYRCFAFAAWVHQSLQRPVDYRDPEMRAVAQRLAEALARTLDREQRKQVNAAWRDAVQWLGELERKIEPIGNVLREVRKEHEHVRDRVHHARQLLRDMCDQLRDAGAGEISQRSA